MDNEFFLREFDERLKTLKLEIVALIAGNTAELRSHIQGVEDRLSNRLDTIDGHIISRELEHLNVADRHGALAETVEIMATEGRRLQRSVADLLRITTGLVELSRRHDKRLEKLEGGAA